MRILHWTITAQNALQTTPSFERSKLLYVRPLAKMFTLVNQLTRTQLMALKTTISRTCKRLGIGQFFQAQGRIEIVVKGRFSGSVRYLLSCSGDVSKWTETVKPRQPFEGQS